MAQQVRAQGSAEGGQSSQRSQTKRIFGISSSSRIGWIIYSYLRLVPSVANNQEKMAETTELYDGWLKLELLDHYERMTTKKRMGTVAMQQWLAGAAVHLHMRIHQVRLNSVPLGSAESLRWSYKSGLGRLVQDYTAYLYRNIRETGPQKPRAASGSRQTNTFKTNMTCLGDRLFNDSLVSPGVSTDALNDTTTPNSTAAIGQSCQTDGSSEDFGLNVTRGSDEITAGMENRETLSTSAGLSGDEEVGVPGLLVIEPQRNVSHSVQHHPCEAPAIQQALVTRIMNAQDLERNRNFFRYADRVFYSLLRQRDAFELRTD